MTKSKVQEKATVDATQSIRPIDELELARKEIQSAAMALDARRVRLFNMDPSFAASVVSNAWPVIDPLLVDMKKLWGFDGALVSLVPVAAKALLFVDSRIPRKPQNNVAQLQVAVEARRSIVTAARPLAERGILDGSIIELAAAGVSYLDVGKGLLSLCSEIALKWSAVEGKSVLTAAEIEAAQALGHAMITAGTPRAESAHALNELEDERARIATLLHEGWTELRAAAEWLRRSEGDAGTIVPSLYTRGASRTKGESSEPTPAPTPDSPRVREGGSGDPLDDPFNRE
jgi:hypothetical protein